MGDLEEQEDELLALESIYDVTVLTIINETDDRGGQFDASPHLPDPFYIQSEPANKDLAEVILHKLNYLPPVVINFQLPYDYPSVSPPNFTITCKWLTRTQLSQVCQKLDELWKENIGGVILFSWIKFLQEELYEFLQLSSPLDIRNIVTSHVKNKSITNPDLGSSVEDVTFNDPRCFQDIKSQNWLLVAILEYDRQIRSDIFEKSFFLCNVCFLEKQGSNCISFNGCDHVFCSECMRGYFIVQINDGNVHGLICPHDKCESEAQPSQVKDLVPEEKFHRYDQLLLKTGLDGMMDIMYCPRIKCQYPVLMEKGSNIGRCPSCQFVFCHLCKLVYHGLSPCRLKANELKEILEEYENADREKQKFLERKYGRRIIQEAMEESISKEWLDNFAKQCPACCFYIQKIDGCNKMTCIKCRTYFCWLCGETLSRSSPYCHYNVEGPCQNRLFEGVEENDDDEDWFLFDEND